MKKIIYLLLLISGIVQSQINPKPTLIGISSHNKTPAQEEILITTTSTLANWSPQLVTNTGETFIWEVTGGVVIGEELINDPTFDLSSNTGTATIHIKSDTNFSGFTHVTMTALDIVTVDFTKALDMVNFSCKLNPAITYIDVTTMTSATDLTIRSNGLTTLDVGSSTSLTSLYAYDNALATIELDSIIIDLDINGLSNGTCYISGNTGLPLTATSYDEYLSLVAKGWSINVANSTPVDTEDPVIGTLSYANVTDTTVELSATATDNIGVTSFDIYKDLGFLENVQTSGNLVSYEVGGLIQNTNYDFYVVSKDAAGNSSGNSNTVNFTTNTTPPLSGDVPLLSNFRTDPNNLNHILFDSSEIITGSSGSAGITGFTASGKSITQLTINTGATTGHYFTTTANFTFWDNNLIRYDGGSDIADVDNNTLYNMRLQYIDNLISEPSAPTDKYVSVTGGGDGSGDSEANAWTIAQMNTGLQPGQTAWVKAGDYGNQKIIISGNGFAGSPKKIIGYKAFIGDIVGMYWNYGDALDSTEMPLLTGTGVGSGNGIALNSNYLVVRNIQVTNYNYGIDNDGEYNRWDNLLITETKGDYGIHNRADKLSSTTLTNITIVNAVNSLIRQFNDHNLIEDCRFYDDSTTDPSRTDYYISQYAGSNNIFLNNHVERKGSGGHTGHGISLKGSLEATEYNLIENNLIVGINQALEFRHSQVKYCVSRGNVFNDGDEVGNGGSIVFRDAASYCVSINDWADGVKFAVRYGDSASEDGGQQITSDHCDVINMVGNDNADVMLVAYTPLSGTYNRIINSTFTNCTDLTDNSIAGSWSSTNEFINCIFDTITNRGSNDPWTFTNNLIWGSWATTIGTGSININPLLDINYKPIAAFSTIRKVPVSSVEYDKNGLERNTTLTTVGAVLHADETP